MYRLDVTEERMEKLMKEYNKNPNRSRPITREEIEEIEEMRRINQPESEEKIMQRTLTRGLQSIGFEHNSVKLFVEFTMNPSEDLEKRELEEKILRIIIKEAIVPRIRDYNGRDDEIMYIKNMYLIDKHTRSRNRYFGSHKRRNKRSLRRRSSIKKTNLKNKRLTLSKVLKKY